MISTPCHIRDACTYITEVAQVELVVEDNSRGQEERGHFLVQLNRRSHNLLCESLIRASKAGRLEVSLQDLQVDRFETLRCGELNAEHSELSLQSLRNEERAGGWVHAGQVLAVQHLSDPNSQQNDFSNKPMGKGI